MRHASSLAPFVFVIVAASCGGSTGTTLGDGGLGEGGCLEGTPTQGAACNAGQVLCHPGSLCCGGEWTCSASTNTWNLLQGGCACEVDAGLQDAKHSETSTEGSTDAPADRTGGDAPASGDSGSCPPSCNTSNDCSTCPMKAFGGWSCGPGGVCQFMG